MPRQRQRATLESGLRLDLKDLIRPGAGKPGAQMAGSLKRDGETLVQIIADLMEYGGNLILQHGDKRQHFHLVASKRHLGGRQWYVLCPRSRRKVRVLWKPYGADVFASRYVWGRQAAYQSQFHDPIGRAWQTQAKIKARLIGDLNPDDWELPPKPKRMRWATYNRMVAKFDEAEEVKDDQLMKVVARFGRL